MITQEKYNASVDKVVKVSTMSGKQYYLDLGYEIKRIDGKNYFLVDLRDLKPRSCIKILVRCPGCSNTRFLEFAAYYKAHSPLCRSCNSKTKAKDITGQRFGKLVAMNLAYTKNNKNIWLCQCDCGRTTEVIISNLINGNTKSCNCLVKETAKKHMTNLRRNQGCFIKEDHTKEELFEHLKTQSEAKDISNAFNKQVAKDREYLCYLTGINEWGNIDVHHLQGKNKFPKLAYELDNLVCLRKDLHKEFHHLYGYGNNTAGQFYEFLSLRARV